MSGTAALERLKQDLGFGARMLGRTPTLMLTVVLTLGLGIGATSAVFSILEAVLLRPLPYQHPDRLVAIWDGHVREASLAKVFASYEDFEIWKAHSTSFEELAVVTWATGDRIVNVRGRTRTAHVMRVPVLAGRPFDGRDREGSQPVAIVNDALVRRYFPNENPIGQRVRYGNDARAPWLTIVGVVGNQKTMNLYREMTWADAPDALPAGFAERAVRGRAGCARGWRGRQSRDRGSEGPHVTRF
jgi:hypothetical protein